MDYNKYSFLKMKVNSKVSAIFTGIIEDIPNFEEKCNDYALVKKGGLITYEKFYLIVYKCVLDYIPKEDENLLIKAITMLPRAKKNIQRIIDNKGILELQRSILDKYFYSHGNGGTNYNIKDKINELKDQIDELIADGDLQMLDAVLEHFENRMRDGFLADMKKLSLLLEKRK